MKTLLFAALLTTLTACTATPDVYLAAEPVEIAENEIAEYWLPKNAQFNLDIPAHKMPSSDQSGYVKVRFLIDSNGNAFNKRIVESVPEGVWDAMALQAIDRQGFVAAKSNTAKTPVYYTQKVAFE